MRKNVDSAGTRQGLAADDARYHAGKLAFGRQGTHEGWIEAEEARAAKTGVSAETRRAMIAVAAYYLAEKRGFPGYGADEDWIEAESEIDEMLQHRIGRS